MGTAIPTFFASPSGLGRPYWLRSAQDERPCRKRVAACRRPPPEPDQPTFGRCWATVSIDPQCVFLVVISAFVLIASSKALFIFAMASSMLEFDDVVDVTEPVDWDIASLSVLVLRCG